jgi:hypothetical protein
MQKQLRYRKLELPEILGANIHEKIYRWPWLNKELAYVQLISKLLGVKEVVVFGKGKLDDRLEDLNKNLRRQIKEAQLLANDPNKPASLPLGLLAKLLPKKWRPGYKDAQRKKRHDDILRSY